MKKFSLKPWYAIAGFILTYALNYLNDDWIEGTLWFYIHDLVSYLYGIFIILFLYLVVRNFFRWLKEIIIGRRSQFPPAAPSYQISQQSEHHQE